MKLARCHHNVMKLDSVTAVLTLMDRSVACAELASSTSLAVTQMFVKVSSIMSSQDDVSDCRCRFHRL